MAKNNTTKDKKMDAALFEATKKRLQQICEYTVMPYSGNIEEDDNDQQPQDNGDQMPPMGDPMQDQGNQMPPMGDPQDQQTQGGNEQMPPMDDPMSGGAQQGPEGFNPQDQGNGDISATDFEGADSQVGADDDVVDITELTDTQKETQHDIDKLDAKFATIIKQIGSFEELIRQNDQKIDDLKTEFEKRNPTQIEKLSMQTAKSYPFNVTPEEYWEEKEKTSNYSTENDENGVKQGQYVITKNDVNGDTDWKSISDSLDDDDFMYNQTLNGILKI